MSEAGASPEGATRGPSPLDREARIALAAAGAALVVFAGIAAAVALGATDGFDAAALPALRGDDGALLGGRPKRVNAVRDLTALGSITVQLLVLGVAAAAALAAGRRAVALHLAALAAGVALLVKLLKAAFARPRPDVVAHLDVATSASFPSGHALGAAAVYLTFALLQTPGPLRRTALALAVLVTGAVGLSRCALGVHYPTDVAAGWAAGAAWAALCWAAARTLDGRAGRGDALAP